MALVLTASITEKQNVILPLAVDTTAGAVVRLAALTTDYLGTFTASGGADSITWSLFMPPPFLSLEEDPLDNTVARLKFTGPSADTRTLQCYLQAEDGSTKVKYPLAIEVTEPFSFVIDGRTDNYAAYDSTAPAVTFTGKGLYDLAVTDGSVQFIPPSDLPSGLHFITGNGETAKLLVSQPSASSTSGGMLPSTPGAYTFMAYRPGSMYDSIDRPFKRTITLGTLSSKIGSLNSAFSYIWNETEGCATLNALTDYLGGADLAPKYEWSPIPGPGTVGHISGGGTATDAYMNWTPTAAGEVSFELKIIDSITGTTTALGSLGPIQIDLPGVVDWTNSAIKVKIDAPYKSAYVGHSVTFTLTMDTHDFVGSETITVTPTISGATSSEPSISNPSAVTLTALAPSQTVTLTIPESSVKSKWVILFSASNAGIRYGTVKAVVISGGLAPFAINNNALIGISQVTGGVIQPTSLVASDLTNMTVLRDAVFSLVDAPPGISIVNNAIVGAVPFAGTFSFKVMATNQGYAPSYTNVSLEVATSDKPLSIQAFYSESDYVQDNTQFLLHFPTTGTPKTLTVQRNSEVPLSVVSSNQSTEVITGTSVFGLVGTDFRGKTYIPPVLETSSSTANLTKLPGAPTIATIDQNGIIHINWQPASVNDSYTYYRGWNIQVSKDGGSPQQLLDLIMKSGETASHPPTGLDDPTATNDSRSYSQKLQYGEYTMMMQALSSARNTIQDSDSWGFYAFPEKLDVGTILMDKTAVKLKESLTIKLGTTYSGADFWRISYSDGTTSGWLPVTAKTQSKSFNVAGPQTVTVEFEKGYLATDPHVKLRRSTSFPVYVQNEVLTSASIGVIGTANVGFGGEAGFEVVDNTAVSTAKEPYEVIVKALVKDDVTQELKMLVTTSRNNNASSILNTMAADVFPIAGRPHLKDLILPNLNLNGDLSLISPVTISTEALQDATTGNPLSEIQLQATGGTAPYDWYSDSLPFGLKLSSDGTLSGTPLQQGVYNINFAVKDSTVPSFISETSIQMTIKSDLAVANTQGTLTGIEDATVGVYYQHKFSGSNGLPPYIWGLESGYPPEGLTLDSNTGTLSGFPVTYNSDEDFDTPFAFVMEVTDAAGSKSSSEFKMNLLPMALSLGNMDQPMITQGDDFKLAIPVYGGRSPYGISNFSSDGAIGNVLSIMSPESVDAVSGLGTPALTILTGDQIFSPTAHPFHVVFPLAATGGTAPYTWSLNNYKQALNTLTDPVVSASSVAGIIVEDGSYTVNVTVIDATGTSVSKVITVHCTMNAGSGGTGTSSLEYVTITKVGTDINNWTFDILTALPDAQVGVGYLPSGGTKFYGVAVWNPVANTIYDLSTQASQIQMKYLYSSVGGVGVGSTSPLVITARSAQWALPKASSSVTISTASSTALDTFSTYNGTLVTSVQPNSNLNYGTGAKLLLGTGTSAISQVYFESLGAVAPDGTPYPDNWQAINNDQLIITQPNLGSAITGNWTWTIGPGTTTELAGGLPADQLPQFMNSDGVQGSSVLSSTGYVRLIPREVSVGAFHTIGVAQTNPTVLQIIATDSMGNSYVANFDYYLVSGGSVRKRGTTWRDGAVLLWPDGTAIGYTSPFSKTSFGGAGGSYYGDYVVSGAVAPSTSATTTLASGTTTPYFPMSITYYQGDFSNRSSISMTAGDNGGIDQDGVTPVSTFTPLAGTTTTTIGSKRYTFAILNDTGTPTGNSQISTVGNWALGTIVTDNNLAKEMAVHCSTTGSAITPVITITSVTGDTLPHSWVYQGSSGYTTSSPYADWFYILQSTGGTGPYTYRIDSNTTLPGVSIHNGQTTTDFGISQSYTGDFLTLSYTPAGLSPQTYYVKVTAVDANGIVSPQATIPFLFVPTTDLTLYSKIQAVTASDAFTTTGTTFWIDAAPVENASQYLTLNTPATFTLSGSLPEGIDLQSPWGGDLMHGNLPVAGKVMSLTTSTIKLVGTPTGFPTSVTLVLTATKPGYTALQIPIKITTASQVAQITLEAPGVATPGVYYSKTKGSPLIKVSCSGFPSGPHKPELFCNFGVLGTAYASNVVSHYPGADTFDLYFDYYADTVGIATLTLANAGAISGSIQLPVQAGTLAVTGTSVSHTVSEYMTTPFTVSTPPVAITGGSPPYTLSAESVSDTTHFYVQNGQFYLNMATVTGGNSYATNIAYRVTDSAGVSALATKQATVTVRVLSESYVTANFLNKTLTVPASSVTELNVPDLLVVQLGHAPFSFFVDSVTYESGSVVPTWLIKSPTGRRFVANRTSTPVLSYIDLGDANVITQAIGGGGDILAPQLINLSGENSSLISQASGAAFSVPIPTTPPVTGTYYMTLNLRVVDALGNSTTGTSIVTLIVP